MTAPADKPAGDARTVLPGQAVRYHVTDPASIKRLQAGIREPRSSAPFSLGTPIHAQPDPSQIVGVFDPSAPPAAGYPPIPPAGFYWAKCSDDTPDEWTVVKVFEEPEGGRWVENTVGGRGGYVHEWGPKLEPHAPLPYLRADTDLSLCVIANAIEDIDGEIADLTAKRSAMLAELTAMLEPPR